MKTAQDLKEHLRRLEAVGNDDFELILLGGPDAYATHELSQLLRQLKVRRISSLHQQRQLFRLSAIIPVFLVLAVVFIGIDRLEMVRFCLGVSLALFALVAWRSYRLRDLIAQVNDRDRRLRRMISHELARRRELA
ncbi:hypothetical protein CEQ90_15175 [Lewinellaceae bacterium SD302]|nr:hypothetical protein CEQ90_15175 [Lewinellaceae bacterium SD302]